MNTKERHEWRVAMDKLEFVTDMIIRTAEDGIIISTTQAAGAY